MHCDQELRGDVVAGTTAVLPGVLELYMDLHRHPELSGREKRTATRFALAAKAAGFEVTSGVGGYGVVAVLRGGEGPVVMLRAELDGAPVAERTGLPYASQVRQIGADGRRVPVMHACGHDAHLAAVIGAARSLAGLRRRRIWRGTLLLVGQPAEETLLGARALFADGLYRRFPRPDVVLAQHLAPLPAGVVAHSDGVVTAAGATVQVCFRSAGDRRGVCRSTANPVEVAARSVARLRAALPREVELVVGALRGGEQARSVPERATLLLSVRAFRQPLLGAALKAVTDVVRAENSGIAGVPSVEVTVGATTPVLVNDAELSRGVRRAHSTVLGDRKVLSCGGGSDVEDFAWYGPNGAWLHDGKSVRLAYWFTGAGEGTDPAARWRVPSARHLARVAAAQSPSFAPAPLPTLRTAIDALTAGTLYAFDPLRWT